jgi:hypothetical protein
MSAFLGTIAVHLIVNYRAFRNNQPHRISFDTIRMEWDSPVAAALWLVGASLFCLMPSDKWHHMYPTIATFTLYGLASLFSARKAKSTSTKDT